MAQQATHTDGTLFAPLARKMVFNHPEEGHRICLACGETSDVDDREPENHADDCVLVAARDNYADMLEALHQALNRLMNYEPEEAGDIARGAFGKEHTS